MSILKPTIARDSLAVLFVAGVIGLSSVQTREGRSRPPSTNRKGRLMKESKINITATMLNKSICDCNADTRTMLQSAGLVDYDTLNAGDKEIIEASFINPDTGKREQVKVSCYRAGKRGDKRIWINGIRKLAKAGDVMNLKVRNGKLAITLQGAVALLSLAA